MPDALVEGYTAGLHLLLRLPKGVDEDAFVSVAAGRGVAVLGTSPMYGDQPSQPGVVIAYGRTSPAMLEEAARRLAVAFAEARTTTPPTGSRPAGRSAEQRRPSTAVDYF
jgi:GntR family transcriptional regulator/MocR family aminotransferase